MGYHDDIASLHELMPLPVLRLALREVIRDARDLLEMLNEEEHPTVDPFEDMEPEIDCGDELDWFGEADDADFEVDNADLEPTLGAPEHLDQTHWSDGDNRRKADDCEDQNEDGTDLDRGEGEHDGLELDEDFEPSLGSLDALIDQRAWSRGNTMDLEEESRVPRARVILSRLPVSNLQQVRPGILLWKGGQHV